MVDEGVGVGQLLAPGQEEPVQNALAALGREELAYVGASERATERERVEGRVDRPGSREEADVERRLAVLSL